MGMLTKRNLTRFAALTLLAPVIRKPFPIEAQSRAHHCGVFNGTGPSRGRLHRGLPIVTNYGIMHLTRVS